MVRRSALECVIAFGETDAWPEEAVVKSLREEIGRLEPFGDRLAAAVRRCGNPVMVGLDPRLSEIPRSLLQGTSKKLSPGEIGAAYLRFCKEVIDVVAPLVPIVKPQVAFFEQIGPGGMEALVAVIQHARAAGLLVVMDVKRGDIGSTAAAYADGWLGADSVWGADAVTVNPYLGDDSLAPFVEVARQRSAGLFVLVKTSNPGGKRYQDRATSDGKLLYEHVAEDVEQLSVASFGASCHGSIGAVVGATYPAELEKLRGMMPHCWLLVPGYGSQGGTARDVGGAFDEQGLGAVINSSRGIIFAHSRPPYAERYGEARWQDAVAAATSEMIDELRSETSAGKLSRDR